VLLSVTPLARLIHDDFRLMQQPLNPYQAAQSVADAELIPFFSGPIEWKGHRFLLKAEQIPLSLWLVACVIVKVDETRAERFVKWRWNKQAELVFQHDGHSCSAKIQFSGANQIHGRLIVDGLAVGESIVPAKGFWLGLLTVAITTMGVASIVRYFA